MQPVGKEVRETLKIIPARVILRRDNYVTYGCSSCKQNDVSAPAMETPKEPALIPGSCASAEAVAHIAVQKYVMGSFTGRNRNGTAGGHALAADHPPYREEMHLKYFISKTQIPENLF